MFQDRDAEYNDLFYNPAIQVSQGLYVREFSRQHNDKTVYSFENGTKCTSTNIAILQSENFTYASGKDVYDHEIALVPTTPDNSPSSSSIASATSTPSLFTAPMATISGYPQPVAMHPQGDVSGYFLNGDNLSDVAVLSISTFVDLPAEQPLIDFQSVVKEFLAKCHKGGKKKLIIDIRGNPGGHVFLAYDAFKQLFPKFTPYSGMRIRASDAANIMGEVASVLDTSPDAATTFFGYRNSLTKPDGPEYASWKDLFGPVLLHGDKFSNIASWQFSNASLDVALGGLVVSGYANKTKIPPSVFASEDIVLVSFPLA